MDSADRGRRRDLWLPGLVGLVGVMTAIAAWGVLVADRRALLLESAREASAESRAAMEEALQQQIESLAGLAGLWTQHGAWSFPDWIDGGGERVDEFAGLVFVEWVDLEGDRHRIAGDPAEWQASDVPDARGHGSRPRLSGPDRDPSGAAGYRLFLPVETPEGDAGVLVASFRLAAFLDSLLYARAQGYSLAVSWSGQDVYSRGTASTDPLQRWWRVAEAVQVPLGGGRWQVVLRPTPEYAAARLTPIPHYLLAVGIVLAILAAIAAYQLRVIVRQSRFLEASNRALERRGQELESTVAERTEALQDAVTELKAFNHSVSHDLRSPLGAILNFAAILEEDYRGRPLDAEGLENLARIRRSALRATALVEDLLRLSEAGRAALTFEPVDMTALARDTFAQVRAAEDAENDEDVDFQVAALPRATGDRTLLGAVFANLLTNALKYSRGCEKRTIAVSGRRSDGECVYEVADNGQGFDMRFVDKIFGLFERLHATDDVEGTGVGLAMVARIVRRHGGRVWAEGRPGEGARFSFAIPDREAP